MNDGDLREINKRLLQLERGATKVPLRQAIGGGGGGGGGGFAIIYTPTELTLRALEDPTTEFAIAYTTTERQVWFWETDDWYCNSHFKHVAA